MELLQQASGSQGSHWHAPWSKATDANDASAWISNKSPMDMQSLSYGSGGLLKSPPSFCCLLDNPVGTKNCWNFSTCPSDLRSWVEDNGAKGQILENLIKNYKGSIINKKQLRRYNVSLYSSYVDHVRSRESFVAPILPILSSRFQSAPDNKGHGRPRRQWMQARGQGSHI